MKYRVVVLALVIGCAAMATSCSRQSGHGNVALRIRFVPFSLKTYDMISKKDFERVESYEIDFYGQHDFVETLKGFLEAERTTEVFEENIRLRAEFSNGGKAEIYYIDQRGIVEKGTGGRFIIQRPALTQLEKKIISYHGVVDRNPKLPRVEL